MSTGTTTAGKIAAKGAVSEAVLKSLARLVSTPDCEVPTVAGKSTFRSAAIEKPVSRDATDLREWARRAQSQLLEEVKKGPVLIS